MITYFDLQPYTLIKSKRITKTGVLINALIFEKAINLAK